MKFITERTDQELIREICDKNKFIILYYYKSNKN